MITKELVQSILDQYTLPWGGTHGVSHWARVLENGLILAELTGAKVEVVQLFAIFHDSRRINEHRDPGHGLRGGDLALALRGQLFELPDEDFQLLHTACAHHTDGLIEGDVTVQTCWDADRLDLGRSGIRPRAKRLCTAAARDPELMRWADERSCTRLVPTLVSSDWEIG
jgi:uncharacterized protein